MITIHATCVAIDGAGLLLRGPPGAGKSDLALRLIEGGAELVADDQVALRRSGDAVIAAAPAATAGMLEVRGVGIVRIACRDEVPLALVVDLADADAIERFPEPMTTSLLDVALPHLQADARAPSAAAKVRLAMRVATGAIMLVR